MRAAGLELDLDIGVRAEALDDSIARDRGPAAFDDRHPQAIPRMAADGRVDGPAARQHALTDRPVSSMDLAPLEHAHEAMLRFERTRDDQKTARILVEPVDQPRALPRGGRWVRVKEPDIQAS